MKNKTIENILNFLIDYYNLYLHEDFYDIKKEYLNFFNIIWYIRCIYIILFSILLFPIIIISIYIDNKIKNDKNLSNKIQEMTQYIITKINN